jgi:hypothetical protein
VNFHSAHAQGHIDPTANGNLFNHMRHHLPHVNVVVVNYHHEFRFNHTLDHLQGPIVLVDFMEYFGGCPAPSNHLLGHSHNIPSVPPNTQVPSLPATINENTHWWTFDAWVKQTIADGRLKLYFKRELFPLSSTPAIPVHPIEWPCYLPPQPLDTKANFDGRPFQVFYNWGYSHQSRPAFQSQAFDLMARGKIEVISSFDHLDAKIHEPQPKWACIHSPHTHRTHINEIARRQAQSKCSVSLPGSGVVCFRSTEAPMNTCPVMVDHGRVWSIPWEHNVNCLRYDDHNFLADKLFMATNFPEADLYGLYVKAQETLDQYRPNRYIAEYILPTIKTYM